MPLAGRFLSWRSTLFWNFSSKNPKKVSISKQKMLLQRAKIIYRVYFRELLNSYFEIKSNIYVSEMINSDNRKRLTGNEDGKRETDNGKRGTVDGSRFLHYFIQRFLRELIVPGDIFRLQPWI